MSLNQLVNVDITVSATAPSQANFGVPLVLAYHTHYPDLIRYYTSLSSMVSDGFTVVEPAYLAATAILDQNPTVASFAIGRSTRPNTQTINLLLSSTSTLDTYTFTVTGFDGVVNSVSVASTGVAATDASSVSTALAAFSNIGTPSHSSATVTLTQGAASGHLVNITGWAGLGAAGQPIIALTDATTNPGSGGASGDLAAIYVIDQGWYGIALTSNSAAEVESAASWAQSNGYHVFSYNNSDAADLTSGSSVFTVLAAEKYSRTIGQFNGSELLSYGGAAILGVILPQTPGSYTAAYKTEIGVPADPASILTGTAVTNLTAANGNYYTTFKGISVLISGITPGAGYIDTTIFIDWLTDAIQTAVYTLLVNNLKIAYTDLGVAQVVNVVKGVLKQGIQNGGLAAQPAPTVSAPLVADISISNVAERNLPNVTFTATLAGAIQTVQIIGSVVLP